MFRANDSILFHIWWNPDIWLHFIKCEQQLPCQLIHNWFMMRGKRFDISYEQIVKFQKRSTSCSMLHTTIWQRFVCIVNVNVNSKISLPKQEISQIWIFVVFLTEITTKHIILMVLFGDLLSVLRDTWFQNLNLKPKEWHTVNPVLKGHL